MLLLPWLYFLLAAASAATHPATTTTQEGDNTTTTAAAAVTTETTAFTTVSTRRPKSETEHWTEAGPTPLLLSQHLNTDVPKRQCGRRYARNARIIGGKDTYEGEFPWAVSVRLLTTHYCGGAVVNEYWILTAAHCVKRYSARYFRVRMGERDVAVDKHRPEIDIQVAEVMIHPDFGKPRRYSNDLALLRLKRPLTYSSVVQPICLPSPHQDLDGRNATAVGWGWMDEDKKGKAKKLQKVQVPLLNNTLCAEWYAEVYQGYVQIYDYQLCAGFKEGGKDACQGDSGGPLVMKDGDHFTIVGVVSAGVGCGRKQLPGIYSRVSVFLDWIQKVSGGL